jgi:hypothetical protein
MATKIEKRKCVECGIKNTVTVCYSPEMKGFFVGTMCECKNTQRYSNYLPEVAMAELFLKSGAWKQR